MKKTYKMFLALILGIFGAMNVNAGEIISLKEVPFCTWDGWGADAQKTGDADCAWAEGSPSGLPYGDSNVINYADLSLFSKLIVTVSEGTPRFLFNRDVDEGQWNENEAESHLIDNTRGGWSSKYFIQDGNTYTVDLKLMVKEKGFAHLHAIKGANWADVTVESMEVERQGKAQQVGWTDLINNGNMEGDDVSSFYTRIYPDASMPVPNSEILDGVGRDDSRGIKVEATAKAANAWDNQFWFRFNEPVPAGTKYRVSFDYRADNDATVSTQAHAEPGDYIHYELFGNLNFAPEWKTFSSEGEVTAQQSTDQKQFLSVAFNLNELADANNYYFDNIKFEVYKYGTVAEFFMDALQIDFGFDTNLSELVKAAGKMRLIYPNDCATVTVNGEKAEILSIEGFDDGRFYIFMVEQIDDDATVEVTFKNPADPTYHLVYTSGPGGDVQDYDGEATFFEDGFAEDAYPYTMVKPTVMSTDPENGSFNLPNNISEFKVKFDKLADCSRIQATINGKALKVVPAEGLAEEITLVREGADLANGEYTINITKIFCEDPLTDDDFSEYSFTVNIGETIIDPNDQPKDIVPVKYFNECAANAIPEGYFVKFGAEDRVSQSSAGSGSRMFDFAAGGDFTKGLYYREGYVEFGSTDGYLLSLEKGKKYVFHFNTAMWKSSGSKTRFQIFDANDEAVLTQMVDNKPDVNGSTAAVNGSTVVDINFVPMADGNYRARWTSALDETSDPGFNENLLANVYVRYMPNTAGLEFIVLLETALENAKTTLEENGDERYLGAAYDNLSATIAKYDGQKYTSPTAYQAAAAALDAAAQAPKDHRALCDDYDTSIKKAIDVMRQNAEKKFAKTELYVELTNIVAKYNGTSEWVNVSEDEENPSWELNYSYDVLKDDAALTVAVPELKEIANTTELLFTEGPSNPEGATGGKGTGIAVLVERLRFGAETLKSLGVAEDDWLIEAANNALTDDDDLVEEIKKRIKQIVYGQLKEADNELFKGVVDENTLEETTPTYDMTVFVKAPNIYKQQGNMNFTEENVPGWTTPEGYNRPGLSVGWGQPKGTDQIAEDVMFQTWGSSYRVEQTITDLPAGVYTVKAGFWERNSDVDMSDTYFYVSSTNSGDQQVEATYGGQAFPFAVTGLSIDDVVVTDGLLTLGVNAGDGTHTFFNDVRVVLTAPADGFDYATAYADGIETLDKVNAKVRAIELFDLNGRRIATAPRGIAIVKKRMSDGTIRTEKVVRK